MKIIKERTPETIVEYYIEFTYKDDPEVLAVMNQILEEAYLPYLTEVLVEAGYHRD